MIQAQKFFEKLRKLNFPSGSVVHTQLRLNVAAVTLVCTLRGGVVCRTQREEVAFCFSFTALYKTILFCLN